MKILVFLLKPAVCLSLGASAIFGSSAANALTFNWSWTPTSYNPSTPTGPVTGTVSGLLDNTPNQTNNAVVTVTSSPTTPTGGWDNANWFLYAGTGFSVSGGAVTSYQAAFASAGGDQILALADGTNFFDTRIIDFVDPSGLEYTVSPSNPSTISFTPASAVPGPLPILGIPPVLLFSRRLKARIKARKEASIPALV